jgi:EAL domain-containing protein (putative c-di-GMP-specific phosphodiesterase class I)
MAEQLVVAQAKDGAELRRADNNERFVAFAFAAADLVAEVDDAGIITYAAGAFRSKVGGAPDDWVGRSIRDLIAPVDHEALQSALVMLSERGRLLPWTVRLANSQRTPVALAGLRLAPQGRPPRLCVTLAGLPAPIGGVSQASSAHGMARAIEARLRDHSPTALALLEVACVTAEMVGPTLESLLPDTLASEIAPGRYGLVGEAVPNLLVVAEKLELALRRHGVAAKVSSRNIALNAEGLTGTQAARALRQALDVFARGGTHGLDAAGFSGGLASYVQGAIRHAAAMRQAIAGNRFKLLFQPIVSLQDRRLHHFEALLRPQPVPGCPADLPQDFVSLTETVGLATELDLAVAAMACGAALLSPAPIAFNLSGQSMQDPAFRDRLVALLADSSARKAGMLAVEMTETAQLEDIPQAAQTASALRQLGVPFCLDDFGAGAADVRVLRALSPDIVKLDGSYIPGILTAGRERAFIGGMVEIAHAAGAAVVAERVETEAEAVVLRGLGAEYGQGWLFGRPAKLPDTEDARQPSGRRR